MSHKRAAGATAQALANKVYERYAEPGKPYGECAVCGITLDNTNKSVDHIKPVSKYPELEFDLDNLVPMCRKHNNEKNAKDHTLVRFTWFNERILPGYTINDWLGVKG